VVAGGVGIAGNLYVGTSAGNIYVGGFAGSSTTNAYGGLAATTKIAVNGDINSVSYGTIGANGMRFARGIEGAPTSVDDGDRLGAWFMGGYHSALAGGAGSWTNPTLIATYIEGSTASATTALPGKLSFFTTPLNGTRTERLQIAASGNIVVFSSTASTSTTTGALVVAGGMGVAGTVNATTVSATTLTGTLSTAAQTNITSLGTLTGLTVNGITFTGNMSGTHLRVLESGGLMYIQAGNGVSGSGSTINFARYLSTTSALSVDLTNLRVGVSNATPSHNLSVTGTLYTSGVATLANIITTSGVYWANGAAYSSGGTTFTGGYVANQSTFGANLVANAATTSTSSSTGALVVTGGVGIGGNLNTGSTSINGSLVGSTTSPLQITGDVTLSGANRSVLGNMYFQGSWKYAANGAGWGFRENNAGKLQFVAAPVNSSGALAAATPTYPITLDLTSGNVAIGFDSPTALFHVKDGTNATYVEPTGNWAGKIFNATDAANEHGLVVGQRWAAATSTAFEVGSTYGGGTGSWRSYFKIDGLGGMTMSTNGTERIIMDAGSGNLVINATTTSTSTTTGALVVKGGVGIAGALNATTKSFIIDHPTKPDMKLRYGSLEGPEFGVYVRGRLTDNNTIKLPDYWTGLVDPNSITVQLTPIGKHQNLFVENIADNKVVIGNGNLLSKTINCFYIVFAERKDVDKLEAEVPSGTQ
jgi:hypothetical protein